MAAPIGGRPSDSGIGILNVNPTDESLSQNWMTGFKAVKKRRRERMCHLEISLILMEKVEVDHLLVLVEAESLE